MEGFRESSWIAARRCYLAAAQFDGETADALERAASRMLNYAWKMERGDRAEAGTFVRQTPVLGSELEWVRAHHSGAP
jgi:hypothetical protein